MHPACAARHRGPSDRSVPTGAHAAGGARRAGTARPEPRRNMQTRAAVGLRWACGALYLVYWRRPAHRPARNGSGARAAACACPCRPAFCAAHALAPAACAYGRLVVILVSIANKQVSPSTIPVRTLLFYPSTIPLPRDKQGRL